MTLDLCYRGEEPLLVLGKPRCGSCGKYLGADAEVLKFRGTSYCANCIGRCIRCSTTFPVSLMSDSKYCLSCRSLTFISTCSCCQREAAVLYLQEGKCPSCASSAPARCYYCGRILLHGSSCYASDFSPICLCCSEEIDKYRSDHAYVPPLVFRGTGKLFYGVEIETEGITESSHFNPGSQISLFLSRAIAKNFYWCKRDGSLSSGAEIVTHPFTYDWLMANKNIFSPLYDLVKYGFRASEMLRCGLHVHMSRKAFSKIHLYKMLKFFYKNITFIKQISFREGRLSLNRFASIHLPPLCSLTSMAGSEEEFEKYQALALRGDNTIEIRIFRSTLIPECIIGYVELCQAIYDFTGQHSIKDISSDNFLSFVQKKYKYCEALLSSIFPMSETAEQFYNSWPKES